MLGCEEDAGVVGGPRAARPLVEIVRVDDAPRVETSDATPLRGRPRFFCRDPFGKLVELARIDE